MSATVPDTRRPLVRRSSLNGIDEVEPAPDRRILLVRFFHDAPENLSAANLSIVGGVVVRHIRILDVARHRSDDPDVPVMAAVSIDRVGDASTYRLKLTGLDDIDPRYTEAPFIFFPDFDDETDCACETAAPAPGEAPPPLDYLAKDYTGFRQVMLDRLAITIPDWQERHVPDVGIMLVELMAYVADRLSYFQDAAATEAYLATARRRISVRRHVRLIDYVMHDGCCARALVQFTAPAGSGAVDVASLNVRLDGDDSVVFQAIGSGDRSFPPERASMRVHTWGQRGGVLAKGAVGATLVDPDPSQDAALQAGDFLVLEVVAPGPTHPAEPDPRLRHAVRLTSVARSNDPLLKVALLEVGWSSEDALPADFPIDDSGSEPFAVVLGNLVLMQQGLAVTEGTKVGLAPIIGPGRRRSLSLSTPGLGFAEPIQARASAFALLTRRDPRMAVPLIDRLQSWTQNSPDDPPPRTTWTIKPDLIDSGPDDPHAVVEVDDDGVTFIRFGDGVCGQDPQGEVFEITYRVGNGPAGNVGADRLNRPSSAQVAEVASWTARNPLPASGGVVPEDVATVKLLAPHAFRDTLVRAITAQDYADLAVRLEPAVQRATCDLIPSGGRFLARVAIDPLGTDAPAPDLVARVATALEPYRRIGHDVLVVQGEYVPLLLVLRIALEDGFLQGHVRRAVRDVLGSGMRRDGTPGAFHPDNLTFGTPIYSSQIIAAVQALDGVRAVWIIELARLFDRERGGTVAGVLAMGWNEIPRLDDDPLRPNHGRLVLRFVGGLA